MLKKRLILELWLKENHDTMIQICCRISNIVWESYPQRYTSQSLLSRFLTPETPKWLQELFHALVALQCSHVRPLGITTTSFLTGENTQRTTTIGFIQLIKFPSTNNERNGERCKLSSLCRPERWITKWKNLLQNKRDALKYVPNHWSCTSWWRNCALVY